MYRAEPQEIEALKIDTSTNQVWKNWFKTLLCKKDKGRKRNKKKTMARTLDWANRKWNTDKQVNQGFVCTFHEKRIRTILFPNFLYEDLWATINPLSKSKILKIKVCGWTVCVCVHGAVWGDS